MRKGRFTSISRGSSAAVASVPLADLLLGDIRAASDLHQARIGAERATSIANSALFLLVSHLICGATLLVVMATSANASDLLSLQLPLAALLLLDGGLLAATRLKLRHHLLVRLSIAYAILAGLLWSLLAAPMASMAASEPAVRVALAAGFVLLVPAFLSIPAIIVCNGLLAIAAIATFGPDPLLLACLASINAALAWFSLSGARAAFLSADARVAAEEQAQKASRFVAEFEQSGRGWFWETCADGTLSYVSQQLADDFETSASKLFGRSFAELLMIAEDGDAASGEQSLSFHLSARFPFSDVTVRAKTEKDVFWSVSGTPVFDDYGRFLGFRGIGTDLTEKRRSEAEISRLARFDSLTGLPNRAQMRQMLDEALRNASYRRKGCTLFLIDLDRFKNVNDTLGHPAGDELLRHVAQRLTRVIGAEGQVGRLGGDEFEAVLPGIDEQGRLSALADRLIQHVSAPYIIHGQSVSIGASIGIAVAQPNAPCADALIRNADLALYAAKAAGRGTHCFFAPEMHSEAKHRQILENDLRNAITREELALHFQPLVNTVTEELVGFEALLRWQHPSRGTIMPADFVPLAEECGLITGIGAWVLRTACAEAAKWPDHIGIAVNLSPIQFASRGLPGLIMNAVASAHLDPARLELEITESVFLADSAATDDTFAKLKAIGVRLVLDDFGTGYSSLGYLKKAPFDKIKIDQSFIRGAAAVDSRNAALVRAIVAMAEGLGMETTAEGAETAEEVELIRELGCSQVQGFIFGRPMPAEDALEIASRSKSGAAQAQSRAPRHGLIRLASLQWQGASVPVRLRNISPRGALVESEREIPSGADVQLDLPGCGLFAAQVRWCQPGRLGLSFNKDFDLKKLTPAKKGNDKVPILKPNYLNSEADAASPWAGRHERLQAKDVRSL